MELVLLVLCLINTIFINSICEAADVVKGSTALDNFPLIDGHNDLPQNLFRLKNNKINELNLNKNLTHDESLGREVCNSCYTDLVRLRKGKVGGLFWVAYVNCNQIGYNPVRRTLEQIDVIRRLIKKYPDDLQLVTTADGIEAAFKDKKIASLIGVEGGHSIDNSLAVLRTYYDLGVRYMTLTHSCNLPWADASPIDASESLKRNLTRFGEMIILEMNRLGMMVDLSHVSHGVMSRAIEVSRAPCIFSHSSSFTLHNHHRNVPDYVLKKIAEHDGIVMVNFFPDFIGEGDVTIHTVAAHINYISDVAGVDHVGIGADYDGINRSPVGLEDVSKYPDLFDLLHETDPQKWTIENLEKLAGRNLVRVFKKVENVRDQLSNEMPIESYIGEVDGYFSSAATLSSDPKYFSSFSIFIYMFAVHFFYI